MTTACDGRGEKRWRCAKTLTAGAHGEYVGVGARKRVTAQREWRRKKGRKNGEKTAYETDESISKNAAKNWWKMCVCHSASVGVWRVRVRASVSGKQKRIFWRALSSRRRRQGTDPTSWPTLDRRQRVTIIFQCYKIIGRPS